jgi:hypothetical protein
MLQKVWLSLINYGCRGCKSIKYKDDGWFEGVQYKNGLFATMVMGDLSGSL